MSTTSIVSLFEHGYVETPQQISQIYAFSVAPIMIALQHAHS